MHAYELHTYGFVCVYLCVWKVRQREGERKPVSVWKLLSKFLIYFWFAFTEIQHRFKQLRKSQLGKLTYVFLLDKPF